MPSSCAWGGWADVCGVSVSVRGRLCLWVCGGCIQLYVSGVGVYMLAGDACLYWINSVQRRML